MKKTFSLTLWLLLIWFSSMGQSFKGHVVDSLTHQPIEYANIYLVEFQTGVITNSEGDFVLPGNISGKTMLQISYVGYRTSVFTLDLSVEKERTFYLSESHLQLHEVVISTPSIKLQQDNIVSVVQKSISQLYQTAPVSLTEAISHIPGIDNYSTGSGIGKPVIRGLSGNRIVVYAQNVRVENQQWGDEHGLGIGNVGIENVEVIKGASSLLYGADALGGVLYFKDAQYANLNSFEMLAASTFHSNSLGTFNDIGLKFNKNSFRMNLFGSYSSNADYQLPNFNRVLNTRFNQSNFKSSIGYNHKKWIGNLSYSFLRDGFGITESDTVSNTTGRHPELPSQEVDNHLLSLSNTFFPGRTKISTTVGYSLNNRKEFEETPATPGLNLLLQTLSYYARSNTSFLENKLQLITGLQGMWQQNANKGEELLIPDAIINDIGFYTVIHYAPIANLNFEGGIRFDNRNISTSAMQTDEVQFQKLNKNFSNFNFAIGSSYRIRNVVLRVNATSGFRAPNTSELVSNGVHEGTARYEIGNEHMKSEQATQVDLSIEYENDHFHVYLNPYLNHINNYIFLSPTDSVIDHFPVFFYKQTKANLFGGEAGIHWHPHPLDWLHIETNYSAVFGSDRSGNALPLVPANKILTSLRGEFKNKGKVKFKSVFIEHIYKFRQSRIASYETSTPSYHLLNTGLVVQVNLKRSSFQMTAGIKNMLNTNYIDHLSRFKYLDVQDAGINVYFGVKWDSIFSAKG